MRPTPTARHTATGSVPLPPRLLEFEDVAQPQRLGRPVCFPIPTLTGIWYIRDERLPLGQPEPSPVSSPAPRRLPAAGLPAAGLIGKIADHVPCTCIGGFKERNLDDPLCPFHSLVDVDGLVALIERERGPAMSDTGEHQQERTCEVEVMHFRLRPCGRRIERRGDHWACTAGHLAEAEVTNDE